MDEAVPVEELVGAVSECVEAGYVRHIGLTQLSAEDVARIEDVFPAELFAGMGMRNFTFRDGRIA